MFSNEKQKGVNLNGMGCEKELGGLDGGKAIVKIYNMIF